jgi:hypothetical protein
MNRLIKSQNSLLEEKRGERRRERRRERREELSGEGPFCKKVSSPDPSSKNFMVLLDFTHIAMLHIRLTRPLAWFVYNQAFPS